MSPSATPATQNEDRCRQVPRLPPKVPRRHRRPTATKRATQCHQCHACHGKPRWMWDGATPATWNEGGCHLVPRLPRKVCEKVVCERWYVTKMGVKDSAWQRWMWKMVCDKVVCERWYVTKMVCDRYCVKDGVSESCMWKMVCDKDGVWQRWCVTGGRREAGGGREATRDTESKTRTPHKVVGKNQIECQNRFAICTFRWYVRNFVRIVLQRGDRSKKEISQVLQWTWRSLFFGENIVSTILMYPALHYSLAQDIPPAFASLLPTGVFHVLHPVNLMAFIFGKPQCADWVEVLCSRQCILLLHVATPVANHAGSTPHITMLPGQEVRCSVWTGRSLAYGNPSRATHKRKLHF